MIIRCVCVCVWFDFFVLKKFSRQKLFFIYRMNFKCMCRIPPADKDRNHCSFHWWWSLASRSRNWIIFFWTIQINKVSKWKKVDGGHPPTNHHPLSLSLLALLRIFFFVFFVVVFPWWWRPHSKFFLLLVAFIAFKSCLQPLKMIKTSMTDDDDQWL